MDYINISSVTVEFNDYAYLRTTSNILCEINKLYSSDQSVVLLLLGGALLKPSISIADNCVRSDSPHPENAPKLPDTLPEKVKLMIEQIKQVSKVLPDKIPRDCVFTGAVANVADLGCCNPMVQSSTPTGGKDFP